MGAAFRGRRKGWALERRPAAVSYAELRVRVQPSWFKGEENAR